MIHFQAKIFPLKKAIFPIFGHKKYFAVTMAQIGGKCLFQNNVSSDIIFSH
jgi:hypothetical protein